MDVYKSDGPWCFSSSVAGRLVGLVLSTSLAACGGSTGNVVPVDLAVDAESADYLIGPGDQLQVYVWNQGELTVKVPVRPDGKITTPLVEDMPAAGKSTSQLAEDIEGVLSKYVRSPEVNIMVLGTADENYSQQVRVVGQAVNPQAVSYRKGMTLLDVMIEVGGLAEFAAGNRAKIIRRRSGTEQTIPVRLKDLIDRGDTSKDVAMLPGDVLMIPQSRF